MFWVGVTIAVLIIVLMSWLAARWLDGGSHRRDPEDRAVLPMSDEDGPFT